MGKNPRTEVFLDFVREKQQCHVGLGSGSGQRADVKARFTCGLCRGAVIASDNQVCRELSSGKRIAKIESEGFAQATIAKNRDGAALEHVDVGVWLTKQPRMDRLSTHSTPPGNSQVMDRRA